MLVYSIVQGIFTIYCLQSVNIAESFFLWNLALLDIFSLGLKRVNAKYDLFYMKIHDKLNSQN